MTDSASRACVLYLQYTNPAAYPPLQHSSRLLADEGWEVLFLGSDSEGSRCLRFPPHERITVRRLSSAPPGWRQKLHYVFFALWALAWVARWRPQWVYASDPMACPAALLLSCVPGVSVVYHEHDSPPPEGQATNESAFFRLVRRARSKLSRRAAVCVLPNEQRVQHFVEETGTPPRRVQCVWNCPARSEAEHENERRTDDKIHVFYHGSLNKARLPFTVLEALAQLPDHVHLRVAGYETAGSKGYCDELKKRARRLGIAHRVDILGAVPRRHALLEHTRRCHIGLSFMPMEASGINMQHMAGASNKPFDYLACGLPLVVSDLPDWRAMYVEPGYGRACDPTDPRDIATTIQAFLDDPQMAQDMGRAGRERIAQDWNYESGFEDVMSQMERAVA
jgi:glycosyltransferase involved in cell wall biosynthesis